MTGMGWRCAECKKKMPWSTSPWWIVRNKVLTAVCRECWEKDYKKRKGLVEA